MEEPLRIMLAPEIHRRARRRAAGSGLSLSEYVAGLVRADLETWTPEDEAPAVVPVTTDDPPEPAVTPPDRPGSDIGEAVAARMNKPPESSS